MNQIISVRQAQCRRDLDHVKVQKFANFIRNRASEEIDVQSLNELVHVGRPVPVLRQDVGFVAVVFNNLDGFDDVRADWTQKDPRVNQLVHFQRWVFEFELAQSLNFWQSELLQNELSVRVLSCECNTPI